jgi:hypothetical protein
MIAQYAEPAARAKKRRLIPMPVRLRRAKSDTSMAA